MLYSQIEHNDLKLQVHPDIAVQFAPFCFDADVADLCLVGLQVTGRLNPRVSPFV